MTFVNINLQVFLIMVLHFRRAVKFSFNLDLSSHMAVGAESASYQLHAVVVHHGNDIRQGHYTSNGEIQLLRV